GRSSALKRDVFEMAPRWRIGRGAALEFARDDHAGVAILFALCMPLIIGAMGLGFEVANWYMTQRAMQNAADAAVLAAASNAGTNYDAEARAVAAQYGFTTGVAVGSNAICPGGARTCYQVTIAGSVPLFLSPVIGFT